MKLRKHLFFGLALSLAIGTTACLADPTEPPEPQDDPKDQPPDQNQDRQPTSPPVLLP